MRVSTVTLCTLALLTAEEGVARAIASPMDELPAESASDMTPIAESEAEAVESVASPSAVEMAAPESSLRDKNFTLATNQLQDPAPASDAVSPAAVDSLTQDAAMPVSIAPPEVAPVAPVMLAEAIAQSSTTSTEADLLSQDGSPITVEGGGFAVPAPEAIEHLQERLRNVGTPPERFGRVYEGSPAITLAVPSGYGSDGGTGFVGFSFQPSVRGSDKADATMEVGVGLGDADDAVGVELSYTLASFGNNRDFGTGGFNAKLHRRLGEAWSIAAGWEGFLTTGNDPVDFEDSIYGAVTYVARTRPELEDAFSRVALTAGVGSGRFRTIEAIEDDEHTLGVFGSVAVRIAQPVSAIVEWTGQDLALGLSIAPFRDFPLVLTPALRDVAGAGDNPRLVLGAGVSFRF